MKPQDLLTVLCFWRNSLNIGSCSSWYLKEGFNTSFLRTGISKEIFISVCCYCDWDKCPIERMPSLQTRRYTKYWGILSDKFGSFWVLKQTRNLIFYIITFRCLTVIKKLYSVGRYLTPGSFKVNKISPTTNSTR